jgi:outer membrane protein assembly factor BamB
VAWRKDGRTLIISNTRDELLAMNPEDGKILWRLPAGGDCTPAIQGDRLAVQSRSEKLGLLAVALDLNQPRRLWNLPFLARRTQSSPIIDGDVVYLIDNSTARCMDFKTGRQLWQQTVQTAITSPVMADGKFYLITDRGNNLSMFRPGNKQMTELGKHRIKALYCPSPSVAEGHIVLRQEDKLVCYDITEGQGLAN